MEVMFRTLEHLGLSKKVKSVKQMYITVHDDDDVVNVMRDGLECTCTRSIRRYGGIGNCGKANETGIHDNKKVKGHSLELYYYAKKRIFKDRGDDPEQSVVGIVEKVYFSPNARKGVMVYIIPIADGGETKPSFKVFPSAEKKKNCDGYRLIVEVGETLQETRKFKTIYWEHIIHLVNVCISNGYEFEFK